jgi:hypothetical protein
VHELERTLVRDPGIVHTIEPAHQFGTYCVEVVVVVEIEALDECEGRRRASR